MSDTGLHERIEAAARTIREATPLAPIVGVVLGSGLGSFADGLSDATAIPYGSIPHFAESGVSGHEGRLVIGRSGSTVVAAMQGRFHYYEGHDLATVTFPIRVLAALGVRTLILTAATGGIRDSLWPGALVCVTDHLNLIGANPLRGPNDDRLGTRFPDMSEVYAHRLRRIAHDEAMRLNLSLSDGVYAALPGPSYETPAEIRMLRTLGADVVGMSTVPEAIVARHSGMEVLALAVVSNWAAGISGVAITHDEVLEAGRAVGPRLAALLAAVAGRVGEGA